MEETGILLKLIKFGLVGSSGLLVDFGVTYMLKEKTGTHKLIANSIGFITAASSNYYLNRIWTFRSDNPNISMEFSSFLAIALVGLAINNGIIWILNQKMHWNFYFSKLIAIGVTVIWNFTANILITFAQ